MLSSSRLPLNKYSDSTQIPLLSISKPDSQTPWDKQSHNYEYARHLETSSGLTIKRSMLDVLPIEVLQCIISHLSTASSIVNLALTSSTLYDAISADDYVVFRAFVQTQFPSIKARPPWRTAALELTARSRAWDRRAFIARECRTPNDETRADPHRVPLSRNNTGYVPVIDSFQNDSGQQILAWGAAGRVMLRVSDRQRSDWAIWRYRNDDMAFNDVLNLRLLRPHQQDTETSETAIVQKASTGVVKLSIRPSTGLVHVQSIFNASDNVDCTDVSTAVDPLLAVCCSTSMQIFNVHDSNRRVQAADTVDFEQDFKHRHRIRCAKFLSDHTIALGVQFLDGRDRAPILVYDVNRTGSAASPSTPLLSFNFTKSANDGRHSANAIAPLDKTHGNDGTLFLSGWTDGHVRLHDIRSPDSVVRCYSDLVDDGQVLCVLPIGHEKFLAGSHQNAVLKTFDMRMSRAGTYCYLESRGHAQKSSYVESVPVAGIGNTQRDFNIFLGVHQHQRQGLWQPLPNIPRRRKGHTNFPRYQGPIYSLSAPSATSTTVFAGIRNSVLQIDFVSTDDFRRGIVDTTPSLRKEPERVLDLSAYDRPRPRHQSTDPVLLRKQLDWQESLDKPPSEFDDRWDDRWQLQTSQRASRRRGSWSKSRQR